MVKLSRRNILGLIGKRTGRYHSCLMTSYSFDYMFFEQRLLSVFRASAIRNVMVLADGHSLDYANEQLIQGKVEKSLGYSICPIYHSHAFHPKVMLLVGKEEGLLFIGSGNLTNSGISTNDEIWGAFRYTAGSADNAFLFGAAWSYFNSFSNLFKATNERKLKWITQYSPWIRELPEEISSGKVAKNGPDLWFMQNLPGSSILSQIADVLTDDKVKAVTVISPYYDEQGRLLNEIHEHFRPDRFSCVVDVTSGLLPHKMGDALRERIRFFNWEHICEDYNKTVNRLHAKLIHFACEGEVEYLLFGSANATMAGLGGIGKNAQNDEVSLLIKRNGSTDWLAELGIEFDNVQPITLTTEMGTDRKTENKWKGDSLLCRIDYAEYKENELHLFSDTFKKGRLTVLVEDAEQTELFRQAVEIDKEEIKVGCVSENYRKMLRVTLINEEEKRVANYALIHFAENLERGNPDPTIERLSGILGQDEFSTNDWRELLEFANQDRIYRDLPAGVPMTSSGGGSGGGKNESADKRAETGSSKVLAKEVFNAGAELEEDDLVSKGLRNISSVYDLLAEVGTDLNRKEDFGENEEQKLAGLENQTGEGEAVAKKTTRTLKEYEALQLTFISYFRRLKRNLDLKQKHAHADGAGERVSLHELFQLLIGLEIMLKMRNVELTEETITEEKSSEKKGNKSTPIFFEQGSVGDDFKTVKGFLLEIVGHYIVCIRDAEGEGFERYESDERTEKLRECRELIIQKSIKLINFVTWERLEEIRIKDILLLNLFHYIKPDNYQLNISEEPGFSSDINVEQSQKLLLDYFSWLPKYQNKEMRKRHLVTSFGSTTANRMLFHSNHGFAMINEVERYNQDSKNLVSLTKLGAAKNDCYISSESFLTKFVSFP